MATRRFIIVLCLFLSGCAKKEAAKEDFETLMGKALPAWQYVQTQDDLRNLSFFKEIYEKNILYLKEGGQEARIPKVVHFIWIGPKPFPKDSIENVRSWIARHPDWTFKFWTDRERPLPHPQMARCLISDFSFDSLEPYYLASDNFGEQSDLLRMEILFKEGGVYVDHDVRCFKAFDPLNSAFDFYCGMEVPYKTSLYSSVLPTNNILGARAGHPILKRGMEWLKANWDIIEKEYPGKDRDSIICRIAHRTFFVLGEIFMHAANQEGRRDIAFPSFYFNAPKDEWAIYARHHYAGSWFEGEPAFEKMVRQRLMLLSKKSNKLLLGLAALGFLNLLGFALLFLRQQRNQAARQK